MLALPVLTSLGGFFPSLVIYALCWLFMATTGLLFLELSLGLGGHVNILTMAEKTLGKLGKAFAWSLYLFLFASLTIAYIVGCGHILSHLTGLNETWGALLFIAIFGPFVIWGTELVSRLNIVLMLALATLYGAFVLLGFPHVKPELLARRDWSLSLMALPVAFTAFAYQGTVPTLITFMGHDRQKARASILIGSFIPLIAYIIWQWLILGIIPVEGEHGLRSALEVGDNAVTPLRWFLDNPAVYMIGEAFAFLALVTSFFGVTLGLVDFLADGLKVEQRRRNRLGLCLLIFAPALAIAITHPHIFLKALEFAGGYGCALLLGLLPILMVRKARQSPNWKQSHEVPGGNLTLALLLCFVLFELGVSLIY